MNLVNEKESTGFPNSNQNTEETSNSPINTNAVFEAAIRYLDAGLCIIPIRRECKKPPVKWKHLQERLPTKNELHKWFVTWGHINLAVVTGKISGVFVVDCDSTVAYENLCNKYDIATTPMVKTQEGYHLFFSYTEPCYSIGNKTKILPDIDQSIEIIYRNGFKSIRCNKPIENETKNSIAIDLVKDEAVDIEIQLI